jgi:PST family polysaccharide transporter
MALPTASPWRQRLNHLLQGRELTLSVLANAAWQSADSVIRLLVSLFIGVWTARHLGAEDYGRLNYALALVAMVAGLPALGLQQLVIRDLVKEPERTPRVLGTVFALQAAGASVAFAIVVGLAFAQQQRDRLSTWLILVIGVQLLLVPLNLAEVWSHAQFKSRYSAMARNAAFLATSAVRLGLLLAAATVFSFAVAATLEAALTAGLLLWLRRRMGCPAFSQWRFDPELLRGLVRTGWPLTLAMIITTLQVQGDQVLLRTFCGNQQLGVYAAVRQIPLLLAAVFAATSNAALPALVQTYESNRPVFNARLLLGVQIGWIVGLAVAAGFALLPARLVIATFGPGYQESIRALRFCAISFPLIPLATACQPYYIVRDLRFFLFTRTFGNFVVWLAVAMPLIQRYSYVGAILAALACQLFSIALDMTSRETREIGRVKLHAMAFLYILPRQRQAALARLLGSHGLGPAGTRAGL